jgi:hypothetical protein
MVSSSPVIRFFCENPAGSEGCLHRLPAHPGPLLCRAGGTRSSNTPKSNEKRGFAALQQSLLSTCHNPHATIHRARTPAAKEAKSPMSIQEHLVELKAKHRALEEEIADALAHPSTDDTKIAELKRRKLQVKDEIARVQASASVH